MVNKYRAKPTTIDGIRFASQAEATRFMSLRMMEKAGLIRNLEPHPRFELFGASGEHVGWYTADSTYVVVATGEGVVEDVKSPATARNTAYRLRKRLLRQCLGIEVKEWFA